MSRLHFLCLTGITYVLVVLQIEARLTQTPGDAVAYLGDSVVFQCVAERKEYPPVWHHIKVGSSEAKDVYTIVRNGNGNGIAGRMVAGYSDRMEVVGNLETGDYSLRIKSVRADDAGQYTCTARGGIGQPASAQLTVIESSVECHTNASELLGEHVCDHGPDYVKISCSFKATGNYLPKVSWVKSDNMSEILIKETARWSKDRASASSSFVLRADEPGLHGSSYMCILSEPDNSPTDRFRCTTPILNVLKLTHVFGSKILEGPAEVPCPPITRVNVTETGSKWIRRSSEESKSVTVVTKGRTLNLYKPEMIPGNYICIIDCLIGDAQCEVEALTINYLDNEASTGKHAASTVAGLEDRASVIVITVVATLLFCIATAGISFLIIKFVKKTPGHHVPVDFVDSTPNGAGGLKQRNNLAEERARERMRKNAALRQRTFPSENGDVPEGVDFNTDKKSM